MCLQRARDSARGLEVTEHREEQIAAADPGAGGRAEEDEGGAGEGGQGEQVGRRGGRAAVAEEALHAGRDGARAHGEEPVQGALHGAAGGRALEGPGARLQERPHARPQEQAGHLEIVSHTNKSSVFFPTFLLKPF